jgi:hypothetical protein
MRLRVLFATAALAACAPERHPGAVHETPDAAPFAKRPPPEITNFLPDRGAVSLPRAADAREFVYPTERPLAPPDPVLPQLWTTVRFAEFDETVGLRLMERLDEIGKPDEGIAVLTLEELWGTEEGEYEDGLCEPFRVTWDFETDDGEEWEAAISIPQFNGIFGEPQPFVAVLTSPCRAALDAGTSPADAVASGACHETDEQSFFREGTDCRACIESGGKFDDCQAAGECPEQPPLTWFWTGVDGSKLLVETSFSYILSCAPYNGSLWYMVSKVDDDPALPAAFENDPWIGYCHAYTDDNGDIQTGCVGEALDGSDGHVFGEGVPTRIERIAVKNDDTFGWWDRPAFLQSLGAGSVVVDWFWGGPSPGIGVLSAPSEQGGWGLPPTELRPDGADPNDPDDTFARDWVSAYTLKTSTARNGVIVTFDNHSRCAEDAWVGPDAKGRYRCERMVPPVAGWAEDGGTYWVTTEEEGLAYANPLRTIATTGLPDPDVPGGAAIHLACSESYEQIEGWTCPHTFVPDVVPFDDVPQDPDAAGAGALEGEGYRFGKDPDWDIRMTMGSTWRRFHRPYDGEGSHP